MFDLLFWILLLVCALGMSVYLRVKNSGFRQEYVLTSPFAEAVRQLVGIAGGIYLSLVMLTGFLGLNLPERIIIQKMELDPLALFAIGLACVQPVILACWHRIAGGGRR